MDEPKDKSKSFEFSFQTYYKAADIIRLRFELRGEVDALAVFAIELHAQVFGTEPRETADRFEKLKDDFVLKRAFALQDQRPRPPDE
jgi:hypothetical protein